MAKQKKVKKPTCGVCGIDIALEVELKAGMCRTCKARKNGDPFPCPECGGRGKLPSPIPDSLPGVCPQCDGKPFSWEESTDAETIDEDPGDDTGRNIIDDDDPPF